MQDNGLIAVIVGISHKKAKILVGPEVITKAFIDDDSQIKERIKQIANDEIENIIVNHGSFADIKNVIREKVTNYVYHKTERMPLVIPVVMDEN